jgi:hypothetical protein
MPVTALPAQRSAITLYHLDGLSCARIAVLRAVCAKPARRVAVTSGLCTPGHQVAHPGPGPKATPSPTSPPGTSTHQGTAPASAPSEKARTALPPLFITAVAAFQVAESQALDTSGGT